MAIRVVTVTPPAAGADWTYTVPAQWKVGLVAVTAQLITTANPSTSPDQSGGGRPLTYTNGSFVSYGNTGPFAGASNKAAALALGAQNTATQIGTRASSTDWNMANLSVGGWFKQNSTGQANLWTADLVVGAGHHGWRFGIDGGAPAQMDLQWRAGGAALNLGAVSAGAWHLIGCTYDGANVRGYVDGLLTATVPAAATVDAVSEPMGLGGSTEPGNGFPPVGAMAGWFVNTAVLPLARWAAYFTDGSTVSAAQYQTDVLADAPLALWMLGEVQTQTSRTATLQITDGTKVVGNYPGGSITGSAPAFQWTWSTQGASLAQSVTSQVNLVAIPNMTLPAGYTIGTRTLDIVSTDQWGPITLWFDDGTGGGGPGGGYGSGEYLNALLVPDYSHQGG